MSSKQNLKLYMYFFQLCAGRNFRGREYEKVSPRFNFCQVIGLVFDINNIRFSNVYTIFSACFAIACPKICFILFSLGAGVFGCL